MFFRKMKKILLIRSNIEILKRIAHPINCRPPYTLKYIQALLKKETFLVEFIDAYAQLLPLGVLMKMTFIFVPNILVISSTFLDIDFTRQYIAMVREQILDIVIIVVGQGPSSVPKLYSQDDSIDFVLPGESELEVCSIIRRNEAGEQIENLRNHYRNRGNEQLIVQDLDKLPFIEYTQKEIKRYGMNYPIRTNKYLHWGHILTSRGCPYECIFCSSFTRDSYGKQLRLRSAENVLKEIMFQLSLGVNVVSFDDDNFTSSRNHVHSICRAILDKEIHFLWIVHARIDNLDRETLKLLKRSGCCLLRIGVESASTRIVRLLKKTEISNWSERVEGVFELTRDLKLPTAALFMIGSPGETENEILESIEVAKKIKSDIVQISFFTPLPGSDIFNYELEDWKHMHHYNSFMKIHSNSINEKSALNLHRRFYLSLLCSPKFMLRHIWKYLGFYLFNFHVFLQLFNFSKYLITHRIRSRSMPMDLKYISKC